jgi:hypothetical protein
MRTRSRILFGGILVSAFAIPAGPALAQTDVDKTFTTTADNCASVNWSAATLQKYPNISKMCKSVEHRNGKTYVKFEGTVTKNTNRGEQLTVDFHNGNTITLTPPPETSLYLDGKKTPVSQLQRGQDLTFYVAEDRFVAQVPKETPNEYEAVPIVVPVGFHEPAQPRYAVRTKLPSTASNFGIAALTGTLSLALGVIMTMQRRRRRD